MFNLGLHYAKGHGVERDFDQAAYWMEQAAENGDEDAPPLIEKYRRASAALAKLPTGDAQAQADLAGILMSLAGSLEQAGIGRDYEEAFELAQKSAAQGNGDGLFDQEEDADSDEDLPDGFREMLELVGYAEEKGYEEPGDCDLEACIAFVEKLAQAGDTEAMERLDNFFQANG